MSKTDSTRSYRQRKRDAGVPEEFIGHDWTELSHDERQRGFAELDRYFRTQRSNTRSGDRTRAWMRWRRRDKRLTAKRRRRERAE